MPGESGTKENTREHGKLVIPKMSKEDVLEMQEKLEKIGEPEEEEKIEFRCPICGSETFCSVEDNNGGFIGRGYRSWVVYHYCDGCSVMFKDPKKFSVHTKTRS